jgi:hypothetical protein
VADPLSIDTALSIVARTPQVLRALLTGLTSPAPAAGWGTQEIVAHLLDVEDVAMVGRIRRIVEETDPFIRSIDPSGRLRASQLTAVPAAELLEELERVRARDVAWVRSLTPQQLWRTGTHDEVGTLAAADIVNWWAYHDLTHLRQAAAVLQASVLPHLGNTAMFIEVE